MLLTDHQRLDDKNIVSSRLKALIDMCCEKVGLKSASHRWLAPRKGSSRKALLLLSVGWPAVVREHQTRSGLTFPTIQFIINIRPIVTSNTHTKARSLTTSRDTTRSICTYSASSSRYSGISHESSTSLSILYSCMPGQALSLCLTRGPKSVSHSGRLFASEVG